MPRLSLFVACILALSLVSACSIKYENIVSDSPNFYCNADLLPQSVKISGFSNPKIGLKVYSSAFIMVPVTIRKGKEAETVWREEPLTFKKKNDLALLSPSAAKVYFRVTVTNPVTLENPEPQKYKLVKYTSIEGNKLVVEEVKTSFIDYLNLILPCPVIPDKSVQIQLRLFLIADDGKTDEAVFLQVGNLSYEIRQQKQLKEVLPKKED